MVKKELLTHSCGRRFWDLLFWFLFFGGVLSFFTLLVFGFCFGGWGGCLSFFTPLVFQMAVNIQVIAKSPN